MIDKLVDYLPESWRQCRISILHVGLVILGYLKWLSQCFAARFVRIRNRQSCCRNCWTRQSLCHLWLVYAEFWPQSVPYISSKTVIINPCPCVHTARWFACRQVGPKIWFQLHTRVLLDQNDLDQFKWRTRNVRYYHSVRSTCCFCWCYQQTIGRLAFYSTYHYPTTDHSPVCRCDRPWL